MRTMADGTETTDWPGLARRLWAGLPAPVLAEAAEAALREGAHRRLLVACSGGADSVCLLCALWAWPAEGRLVVAVGPEGDFSPAEYARLSAAEFRPVRLGANVLRAETAAAYVLAVADQALRAGGANGPQTPAS